MDPERAAVREQFSGACTPEIEAFDEFAGLLVSDTDGYDHVLFDTAPTGHTLLLLDTTGAYHRRMMRDLAAVGQGRVVTPLMQLQDPAYTRILLVTLPEITPVSEAAALQEDLRRAAIEPYAWVVNRNLFAAGTRDPLRAARLAGEQLQIQRVRDHFAERVFVVPCQTTPPVGIAALWALGSK